jgi:hypothetical protein
MLTLTYAGPMPAMRERRASDVREDHALASRADELAARLFDG